MSIELRTYLINWRNDLEAAAERNRQQRVEKDREAEVIDADINDLDRAIAALSPQDAPDLTAAVAEPEIPAGFTKWEGGKRPVAIGTCVEIRTRKFNPRTKCIAWTVTEFTPRWSVSDAYDDIIAYRIIEASPKADEPAEFISDLTGNPAIEPETGLHGDPVLRSVEIDGEWIDGDDEAGLKRSAEYSLGFEAGRLGHSDVVGASEDWWTGYADGKARRDEVAAVENLRHEEHYPDELDGGYAPVVSADEPKRDVHHVASFEEDQRIAANVVGRFNPFRVKADA